MEDRGRDLLREAQDEERAYIAEREAAQMEDRPGTEDVFLRGTEVPGYSPATHRTKTEPLTEELDQPEGLLGFFQRRLEDWLAEQPDVDYIDTFQNGDTVKGVSFQLAGYGRVKIYTAGA